MRSDRDEIKQGLKDRIEDLCARLLPDGRVEGRLWVAHNPVTRDFSQSKELKVAINGDVGAWKCWRSGDKGDVINLVAYCLETDFRGAMDWSREFLGLKNMSRQERKSFAEENEKRRLEAEQEARNRLLDRRKAVQRLWDSGEPIMGGSPAAILARRYFADGRGCPLEAIVTLEDETFRVHPALEWWEGAVWERKSKQRRKVSPGPSFPAVISAFRSPTGIVTAVHCTFLDPVKPTKALVADPKKAKLMFGEAMGSVIRISAGQGGPLILCEGVEDGLSLAIGAPEARVWAGGSLAGMSAAPVFLPEISAVFVAADNDWHSRQAQAQLEKALETLEGHGKPVEVMRSAVGKDFNDGMTE